MGYDQRQYQTLKRNSWRRGTDFNAVKIDERTKGRRTESAVIQLAVDQDGQRGTDEQDKLQ